ncbi:MAG: peptidase MA family metallohydrolase [Candidatus Aquicultor sp.]
MDISRGAKLPNRVTTRRLTYTLLALILAFLAIVPMISPIPSSKAYAITPQRDWATYESPHFIIRAVKRSDLQQIGQTAESIYDNMAQRYDFHQNEKIQLYIYTDRSAFLSESPSADAAGYASPGQNIIAILLNAGNSTVTLGHEINHIIFINSVPRINTVPQWFIEGLAIHESQPGIEAAQLERYALARDIPDIVGSEQPDSDFSTPQDYAEGYMMITFIIDKFGQPKLYEIISSLQGGADFDTALTQVLGRSQDQLNSDWRAYARNQTIAIWLTRLQDFGWYLMIIIGILAIIVAPIKKRRRMRQMEDDDEPEGD